MKKRKKALIGILCVLGVIAAACFINFIPVLQLRTPDMSVIHGEWVDVYYETEKEAAEDVFQYADATTGEAAQKLGFKEKEDVKIFIYDTQAVMQTKKYGLIGPMLGLDWYIGDNIGTDVILTSPAAPGTAHSYDDIKYAVLHEIIHAYISVVNPGIHLWLTEGTALYLSNGQEFYKEYLDMVSIPDYKETLTRNPVKFSSSGGYLFAATYIEYIAAEYGWDSVLKLIETEDYELCFEKPQKDIYEEWVEYIKNYYQ